MKKGILGILIVSLLLMLASCSGTQDEQLSVYSFDGENEMLSVSNGVIVLDADEETFYGGDLSIKGDLFGDVVSYSTTFYFMNEQEKQIVLSNSVADNTDGTLNISGGLGKISAKDAVTAKADDLNDYMDDLYFELVTVDRHGEENTYRLHLNVTAVAESKAEN